MGGAIAPPLLQWVASLFPRKGIFINGAGFHHTGGTACCGRTCRVAFQGSLNRQYWKNNPVIPGDDSGNQQSGDAINGHDLQRGGCSTSDMWCHQQLCRKNPIVCLWPGMNGLWGGTESDPLSLMPDCRFGFLFSYLLHFFCWYPLKCAKPDCRNYDSAEGQSERHNTNKSGIAHLLLRVPDCLSVV